MAAYAALLSLNFTINQIQQHPQPPISLDQQQLLSLTEKVDFLQNFLEAYSKELEEDELESRIADAAYAAEDVIEFHIVDQIHAGSTCHAENISCLDMYEGLERVIQDMDLIKKEVTEIVEVTKMGAQLMIGTDSSVSIDPVRPVPRMQNNMVVDFGDILFEVLDKLTSQDSNLEIISIHGTGGIGKTTLAKSIYAHQLIVHHFDFLAWVTISQEYNVSQILSQVLSEEENKEDQMREVHELGERVHKELYGRRYLIVMDDIWSIEAWDKVKSFFPKNNNGSKIMITTRNSNLAFQLSGSHDFQMKFLDDDKSWNLFCNIVFGKDCCPIELEDIGKEIAGNCKGLPLPIVVIGGLLTKSNNTREYWQHTLENLNSQINLDNNEHCLQILRRSYKELPIHLKSCFLYMGVFPEDCEISVSRLIKLWVAEGFLKPTKNRSLEEVAKEYVKELIERNLILGDDEWHWNGKVKSCKMHDLLRDMCLREAKRQRFFCVIRGEDVENIPEDINMERRICFHHKIPVDMSPPRFFDAIESTSLLRSLILFVDGFIILPPSSFTFRLLRVFSCFLYNRSFHRGIVYDAEALYQQANLRCISLPCIQESYRFPNLLWNLQTLDMVHYNVKSQRAPSGIWKMCHLRHVKCYLTRLPNPPCREDGFVLESLHTLSSIYNFKCSEEVVKRIPNIRKLKIFYARYKMEKNGMHKFSLNNLGCLRNLESLNLDLGDVISYCDPKGMQNLSLPHSLKKLSLRGTRFLWEDLNTKIGSLPLLQVLNLGNDSCIGPEWETVEGRFCSLKVLKFLFSRLECWMTNDTHFPRLEHLALYALSKLEEIPLSIGDIPTLQSIKVEHCSKSVMASAERIKEEQLSYGNEDLQVLIVSIW